MPEKERVLTQFKRKWQVLHMKMEETHVYTEGRGQEWSADL